MLNHLVMKKNINPNPTFWKILMLFIKVSLLAFGGGNALFPMIKNYCVDKYHWISNEDIDDILVITNAIPGASAIEGMTYIAFLLLKSKWKACLVMLLSMIPHTILFFVLFYLGTTFIPIQYLKVIYAAVIPVIIILLINMSIRYIKRKNNELNFFIHWFIFVITLLFTLFVPVPWSMPIFIIVFFVICLVIVQTIKNKRDKRK